MPRHVCMCLTIWAKPTTIGELKCFFNDAIHVTPSSFNSLLHSAFKITVHCFIYVVFPGSATCCMAQAHQSQIRFTSLIMAIHSNLEFDFSDWLNTKKTFGITIAIRHKT